MSALRLQLPPWPEPSLKAADGKLLEYPVPAGSAIYRRVPICRVGDWFPSGVNGVWHATADILGSLGVTYDPWIFPSAVNVDHWTWGGPADGLILATSFADEVLFADVAIFNWLRAMEMDAGMWPNRSIEWWQEDLLGEPFYGRKELPNYLTGLGLLGVQWPAVIDLGPIPPREQAREETPTLLPAINPLAAQSVGRRALRLINTQEVAMDPKNGQSPPQASAGAPEGANAAAEEQARAAEMERQNAELKAQLSEQDSAAAARTEQRLSAMEQENAVLRARMAARDLDERVAALKGARVLTPAAEEPYRKLAAKLQPQGGLDDLDALLASMPHPPANEFAGSAPNATEAVSITEEDRKVANGLGLKAEDVARERLGLPAKKDGEK